MPVTRGVASILLLYVSCTTAYPQVFDQVRGLSQDSLQTAIDSLQQTEGAEGQVCYLDGRLLRLPDAEQNWREAPLHSLVKNGDRVRTIEDSRAEIDLGQDNLIRLAPQTTIDLRRLFEERANQQAGRASQLYLEEGELWAELNGLEEEDQFEISSGLVGAAITGTGLRLSQDAEQGALLRVYHGEVRLAASLEALGSGQAVSATEFAASLFGTDNENSARPRPVPGPQTVAGPHAVSLEDWLIIVGAMQEVRVNAQGQITAAGEFQATDTQEQNSWIRWNQERNRVRNSPMHNEQGIDGHQGGKP